MMVMNCTVKSRVSFVNHAGITALWPSGSRLLTSVRMPERGTRRKSANQSINNMLQTFPMKLQCYQKRFSASVALLLNRKCIKKIRRNKSHFKDSCRKTVKNHQTLLNNHHKSNLLPLGKETFPKPSAIKMKV